MRITLGLVVALLLALAGCDLTDPLTMVGQFEKSQCALWASDPQAFGGQKPPYCP